MHPFHIDDKRFDWCKWLLLGVTFLGSLLLFEQMTHRPASDISIHATWAGECTFSDPVSFVRHGAHPLWHLLVTLVRMTGLPLAWSAALVTAACKTTAVWLTHRLFTIALQKELSRPAISLYTAVCSVVSAVCVPFYNPTVYRGVGTPNAWHSSTQNIAVVFMLVCVPYTAYCYDTFARMHRLQGDEVRISWKQGIPLGALLFLSLLAKPTFMQAFLPAACLFFLVQWIRHTRSSRYFVQMILCVLPAVVFMILQYMYYFGYIVPWQASMVMEITLEKVRYVSLCALLMLLFPLYTLWVTRRQKKDTAYVLTLIFVAVAFLEFFFLGENGRRAADGNFGWGLMGASLMLWVVCLPRFLKESPKPQKRYAMGWALLAWHLLSGLYYLGYLFITDANL